MEILSGKGVDFTAGGAQPEYTTDNADWRARTKGSVVHTAH